MPYDPNRHHRRSIRLRGYDDAQPGACFITTVTRGRACLFGEIVDGVMRLNDAGPIVEWTWRDLPNHVHGIIVIHERGTNAAVGAGSEPAPTATTPKPYGLPEIVRQFKTFSAKRMNEMRGTSGTPVWQRNDCEHIVRDENALRRIRAYIVANPRRWAQDGENPTAPATRGGKRNVWGHVTPTVKGQRWRSLDQGWWLMS